MFNKNKYTNIIGYVEIDEFTFGRLDIICNRFYPNKLWLINEILDFNCIVNPLEIKIGDVLKIPEISVAEQNRLEVKLKDLIHINGLIDINKLMELNNNKNNGNIKKSTNKISPKLSIDLKPVEYNEKDGTITF